LAGSLPEDFKTQPYLLQIADVKQDNAPAILFSKRHMDAPAICRASGIGID